MPGNLKADACTARYSYLVHFANMRCGFAHGLCMPCSASFACPSVPVAVDALGFVLTEACSQKGGLASLSQGLRIIAACAARGSNPTMANDNCWLCGGWQARTFRWSRPEALGGAAGVEEVPSLVCIRLGFEGWRRVVLEPDGSAAATFVIERVVPPGIVNFVFEGQFASDGECGTSASVWRPLVCNPPSNSRDTGTHCGREFPTTTVPLQQAGCTELEILLQAGGPGATAAGRSEPVYGSHMHSVCFPRRSGGQLFVFEEEILRRVEHLRPPPPPPPPPSKAARKKWCFPDSIFATYRGDRVYGGDERAKVLSSAFETDWGYSSCAKLVLKAEGVKVPAGGDVNKDSDMVHAVAAAKAICRRFYPVVCKAFRHYSATSSEIHTCGWNGASP